jgi:hypothetical protein
VEWSAQRLCRARFSRVPALLRTPRPTNGVRWICSTGVSAHTSCARHRAGGGCKPCSLWPTDFAVALSPCLTRCGARYLKASGEGSLDERHDWPRGRFEKPAVRAPSRTRGTHSPVVVVDLYGRVNKYRSIRCTGKMSRQHCDRPTLRRGLSTKRSYGEIKPAVEPTSNLVAGPLVGWLVGWSIFCDCVLDMRRSPYISPYPRP